MGKLCDIGPRAMRDDDKRRVADFRRLLQENATSKMSRHVGISLYLARLLWANPQTRALGFLHAVDALRNEVERLNPAVEDFEILERGQWELIRVICFGHDHKIFLPAKAAKGRPPNPLYELAVATCLAGRKILKEAGVASPDQEIAELASSLLALEHEPPNSKTIAGWQRKANSQMPVVAEIRRTILERCRARLDAGVDPLEVVRDLFCPNSKHSSGGKDIAFACVNQAIERLFSKEECPRKGVLE
jgi:hypothetical protein